MAINEVIFPTVPNPVTGDWAKAIELIEKAYQNVNSPLQVDLVSDEVPEGATFQVGGHIYHADSDTAITGTSSDYVKLTVSGTTLVPSYVADLTGVTWNKQWNGYYDTSDNLYVFDEVKAVLAGDLSGGNSKFSELWDNNFDQRLKTTDDVEFQHLDLLSLIVTSSSIETLNSGTSWSVPTNVYRVKAIIIGGGGGGGSSGSNGGSNGGSTTFNSISSSGGSGGRGGNIDIAGLGGTNGFVSSNGGMGGSDVSGDNGHSGIGGKVEVRYFTVVPSASVSYAIGAGGAGGAGGGANYAGGTGGNGQIILVY